MLCHSGATPRDFRLLPRRIVLVRHAQSEGNVDNFQYTYVPDPKVPLVRLGEGNILASVWAASCRYCQGGSWQLLAAEGLHGL